MDPISLAIGAVGLGMQIFGGVSAAHTASEQAAVSQQEAGFEQNINNVKQQALNVSSRRAQMEDVRNTQRARAQGTEAAVSQGAQFGSGLQGGLAQSTNSGLFNIQGINQATQTGTKIATQNSYISGDKMEQAALGGQMATDQGISSLGGALGKSAATIGQLGKNASAGIPSAPGGGGGMFFNNSSWGIG